MGDPRPGVQRRTPDGGVLRPRCLPPLRTRDWPTPMHSAAFLVPTAERLPRPADPRRRRRRRRARIFPFPGRRPPSPRPQPMGHPLMRKLNVKLFAGPPGHRAPSPPAASGRCTPSSTSASPPPCSGRPAAPSRTRSSTRWPATSSATWSSPPRTWNRPPTSAQTLAGEHFAGSPAARRQAYYLLNNVVNQQPDRLDLQRLLVKTAPGDRRMEHGPRRRWKRWRRTPRPARRFAGARRAGGRLGPAPGRGKEAGRGDRAQPARRQGGPRRRGQLRPPGLAAARPQGRARPPSARRTSPRRTRRSTTSSPTTPLGRRRTWRAGATAASSTCSTCAAERPEEESPWKRRRPRTWTRR